MITGKNYIATDLSGLSEKTFTTLNPRTNQTTPWIFQEATLEEVDRAVWEAEKAFTVYRNYSGKEKALFLEGITEAIEKIRKPLIETYISESGLPESRAEGELLRTINQLRSFATLLREGSWVEAVIDAGNPERQPLPKPDIRKMLIPIGPVVVFGASNFPFAFSTAGGDTASALAAGCPVISKSHPMHAGTAELMSKAISEAVLKCGLPKGVFSNLNSADTKIGEVLVKHPGVKAIGFTGSIKGGTAIQKAAMERLEPIPVFAEMGSINPVIIDPSALQNSTEAWSLALANSINLGSGQFCTNPGLLLGIESPVFRKFLTELASHLDGLPEGCMLHPDIKKNYEQCKVLSKEQKATATLTNRSSNGEGNLAVPALFTVNAGDFIGNTILHQEVFGPFSLAVLCKDHKELKRVVRQLEGQLTASILGSSEALAQQPELIEILQEKAGRVIFNALPTGVEVCAAMHHGGPFPATSNAQHTSVGTSAIKRWVRPVAFQNCPDELLPDALKNNNVLGISRIIDLKLSTNSVEP